MLSGSRPATRRGYTLPTCSLTGSACRSLRMRSIPQRLAGSEEDDRSADGVEPVVVGRDDDGQQGQGRVDAR